MYNNSYTTYSFPCLMANPKLHLAVNGNRIKTYNHDNEVRAYLKDGTEFQLEFDNDSDCYVKAEITINGKTQSSALVLRPHQRFYLDRFMDEKKKFKFNTFLTGNDDIQKLKEILEKNGRIEVKFYKEYIAPVTWSYCTTQIINDYVDKNWQNPDYSGKYPKNFDGQLTANSINQLQNSGHTYHANSFGSKCLNRSEEPTLSIEECQATLKENKKVEIETGRVEAGSKSKQDFSPISKTWDIFSCATYMYHIMPESQKPKTEKIKKSKDVIVADDIRTYCPQCGRRVKKGWQFCAGCGKQF